MKKKKLSPADAVFDELYRVMKRGGAPGLRALLDQGVDANVRNRYGWTALMIAASWGQTGLIEVLLAHGAKVNAVNDFGNSPVILAAAYGHRRATEQLIRAGADVRFSAQGRPLLEFLSMYVPRIRADLLELLQSAGTSMSENDQADSQESPGC